MLAIACQIVKPWREAESFTIFEKHVFTEGIVYTSIHGINLGIGSGYLQSCSALKFWTYDRVMFGHNIGEFEENTNFYVLP